MTIASESATLFILPAEVARVDLPGKVSVQNGPFLSESPECRPILLRLRTSGVAAHVAERY